MSHAHASTASGGPPAPAAPLGSAEQQGLPPPPPARGEPGALARPSLSGSGPSAGPAAAVVAGVRPPPPPPPRGPRAVPGAASDAAVGPPRVDASVGLAAAPAVARPPPPRRGVGAASSPDPVQVAGLPPGVAMAGALSDAGVASGSHPGLDAGGSSAGGLVASPAAPSAGARPPPLPPGAPRPAPSTSARGASPPVGEVGTPEADVCPQMPCDGGAGHVDAASSSPPRQRMAPSAAAVASQPRAPPPPPSPHPARPALVQLHTGANAAVTTGAPYGAVTATSGADAAPAGVVMMMPVGPGAACAVVIGMPAVSMAVPAGAGALTVGAIVMPVGASAVRQAPPRVPRPASPPQASTTAAANGGPVVSTSATSAVLKAVPTIPITTPDMVLVEPAVLVLGPEVAELGLFSDNAVPVVLGSVPALSGTNPVGALSAPSVASATPSAASTAPVTAGLGSVVASTALETAYSVTDIESAAPAIASSGPLFVNVSNAVASEVPAAERATIDFAVVEPCGVIAGRGVASVASAGNSDILVIANVARVGVTEPAVTREVLADTGAVHVVSAVSAVAVPGMPAAAPAAVREVSDSASCFSAGVSEVRVVTSARLVVVRTLRDGESAAPTFTNAVCGDDGAVPGFVGADPIFPSVAHVVPGAALPSVDLVSGNAMAVSAVPAVLHAEGLSMTLVRQKSVWAVPRAPGLVVSEVSVPSAAGQAEGMTAPALRDVRDIGLSHSAAPISRHVAVSMSTDVNRASSDTQLHAASVVQLDAARPVMPDPARDAFRTAGVGQRGTDVQNAGVPHGTETVAIADYSTSLSAVHASAQGQQRNGAHSGVPVEFGQAKVAAPVVDDSHVSNAAAVRAAAGIVARTFASSAIQMGTRAIHAARAAVAVSAPELLVDANASATSADVAVVVDHAPRIAALGGGCAADISPHGTRHAVAVMLAHTFVSCALERCVTSTRAVSDARVRVGGEASTGDVSSCRESGSESVRTAARVAAVVVSDAAVKEGSKLALLRVYRLTHAMRSVPTYPVRSTTTISTRCFVDEVAISTVAVDQSSDESGTSSSRASKSGSAVAATEVVLVSFCEACAPDVRYVASAPTSSAGRESNASAGGDPAAAGRESDRAMTVDVQAAVVGLVAADVRLPGVPAVTSVQENVAVTPGDAQSVVRMVPHETSRTGIAEAVPSAAAVVSHVARRAPALPPRPPAELVNGVPATPVVIAERDGDAVHGRREVVAPDSLFLASGLSEESFAQLKRMGIDVEIGPGSALPHVRRRRGSAIPPPPARLASASASSGAGMAAPDMPPGSPMGDATGVRHGGELRAAIRRISLPPPPPVLRAPPENPFLDAVDMAAAKKGATQDRAVPPGGVPDEDVARQSHSPPLPPLLPSPLLSPPPRSPPSHSVPPQPQSVDRRSGSPPSVVPRAAQSRGPDITRASAARVTSAVMWCSAEESAARAAAVVGARCGQGHALIPSRGARGWTCAMCEQRMYGSLLACTECAFCVCAACASFGDIDVACKFGHTLPIANALQSVCGGAARASWTCQRCLEDGVGPRFQCFSCDVDVCVACALGHPPLAAEPFVAPPLPLLAATATVEVGVVVVRAESRGAVDAAAASDMASGDRDEGGVAAPSLVAESSSTAGAHGDREPRARGDVEHTLEPVVAATAPTIDAGAPPLDSAAWGAAISTAAVLVAFRAVAAGMCAACTYRRGRVSAAAVEVRIADAVRAAVAEATRSAAAPAHAAGDASISEVTRLRAEVDAFKSKVTELEASQLVLRETLRVTASPPVVASPPSSHDAVAGGAGLGSELSAIRAELAAMRQQLLVSAAARGGRDAFIAPEDATPAPLHPRAAGRPLRSASVARAPLTPPAAQTLAPSPARRMRASIHGGASPLRAPPPPPIALAVASPRRAPPPPIAFADALLVAAGGDRDVAAAAVAAMSMVTHWAAPSAPAAAVRSSPRRRISEERKRWAVQGAVAAAAPVAPSAAAASGRQRSRTVSPAPRPRATATPAWAPMGSPPMLEAHLVRAWARGRGAVE